MGRTVALRELLLGVEGLALLRQLYDGSDAEAGARLDEIRRILDDDALSDGELTRESDARTGYRVWSHNYDEPGNPLIELEQPIVWSLVERLPRGRALDAACGTGRHARRLVELGHDVTGVDLTPEMLERARAEVPQATFAEADLRALPFEDGAFDLAVCGLALAHLDDMTAGVGELARVLRPGGRLTVSVLHPFQAHLGWHAPFADARGERRFVREHPHTHADYLDAFAAAGLALRGCAEPVLTQQQVQAKRRAFRHIPEATRQAYLGLPCVLVWEVEKAAGLIT
ncbi:MAG TPA: class I SAM-dependent methyltransferase [Conexibacter sp.]|jgi:ubiquinone/menaquinone biosynthesis C-methylase UbiE|nr:class I SAM-dependent methyltransferase [Conexibacter sp.]